MGGTVESEGVAERARALHDVLRMGFETARELDRCARGEEDPSAREAIEGLDRRATVGAVEVDFRRRVGRLVGDDLVLSERGAAEIERDVRSPQQRELRV
ncbi:MAG: hypothetical protein AAGC67_21380 [Myxococcota bacterium]